VIFPLGHLAHALHSLKELFEGGDDGNSKSPATVRAEQRSELEGRVAAMNLPPSLRGQIAALIQSGDLHAARQAIHAASLRSDSQVAEVRRMPQEIPCRTINPKRNQDRGSRGGRGL